jgi:hypothetical protein
LPIADLPDVLLASNHCRHIKAVAIAL